MHLLFSFYSILDIIFSLMKRKRIRGISSCKKGLIMCFIFIDEAVNIPEISLDQVLSIGTVFECDKL